MTTDVDQLVEQIVTASEQIAQCVPGLPAEKLAAVQAATVRAKRSTDAVVAVVSAEVGRRSTLDDGAAGFARKQGFSSPRRQVAHTLGVSEPEAGRLMDVGSTLAPPVALPGETEPPKARFVHVAAAVRSAELGVEAASIIKKGLDQLGDLASEDERDVLERKLVDKAPNLSIKDVRRMVQRMVAVSDPRGLEARERQVYEDRTVTIREEGGAVMINARLDPASAAPLVTVLEAMVTTALRRRRSKDPHALDDRTTWQMRADALTWMARHVLGCENSKQTLPKTTVLVRTNLSDLMSGEGVGEILGIDQPVSISAVRRLSADSQVIPLVLGGASEPLDLGRAHRLFTPAQRLALVERDGGCAWCHAPPSWCEAHHIEWWERDCGETNLDNGVLLCTSCHHRLHDDRWVISVENHQVWFIPPRSVDPGQRPRLGGRAAREVEVA